ncbi:MAG: phosphoglycerate dehydrogenase [Cytophagales bacterium]|nr:MAG: phosphoglycerate dehydrogenase [Cytophagales bacterium]
MDIRCLIIDEMHPSILPLLDQIGVQVEYLPSIDRKGILAIISSFHGIIVRSKIDLDLDFFKHADNLKFIARAGAGMDRIDLEEAKKRNIILINAPEGNSNALAEHALSLLLNLMNKIKTSDSEISRKIWRREENRGYELEGKVAAIIGYGHMGKAFAKKLSLLGCKVIAYDKYLINFSDQYVQEASLEEVLNKCEILSIHIPMNTENHQFINQGFFNKIQKNIWFINTARGEVLETRALINALNNGKVIGAGLDVLENEKLHQLTEQQKKDLRDLLSIDSVILTPHVGGWTYESYERINRVLVNKILENKKLIQS